MFPKSKWVGTFALRMPVFMLPISALVFKERLRWQAVLGTLVAMLGVAVLFLS